MIVHSKVFEVHMHHHPSLYHNHRCFLSQLLDIVPLYLEKKSPTMGIEHTTKHQRSQLEGGCTHNLACHSHTTIEGRYTIIIDCPTGKLTGMMLGKVNNINKGDVITKISHGCLRDDARDSRAAVTPVISTAFVVVFCKAFIEEERQQCEYQVRVRGVMILNCRGAFIASRIKCLPTLLDLHVPSPISHSWDDDDKIACFCWY